MPSSFHNYCNGYVAMPIIESCANGGLFALLDDNACLSYEQIAGLAKVNEGELRTVLRVLVSCGFIETDGTAYRLANQSAIDTGLCGLTTLYEFDHRTLFNRKSCRSILNDVIWSLSRHWSKQDLFTELYKGATIAVISCALRAQSTVSPIEALDEIDPGMADPIRDLFVREGLLTSEAQSLTASGKRLFPSGLLEGLSSYRETLLNLTRTLFSARRDDGQSIDADTSGQRERACVLAADYFQQDCIEDLTEVITDVLRGQPAERSPAVLINAGYGDRGLAEHIDRTVRAVSRPVYPPDGDGVRVIHVHGNEIVSGISARACLGGRDTRMAGADGAPTRAIAGPASSDDSAALQSGCIIPIRCFVDHDIRVDGDAPVDTDLSPLSDGLDTARAGGHGKTIEPPAVLTRWRRHLRTLAESIDRTEMILLQMHALPGCLSPRINQADYFFLDTVCSLSGQHPISAEAFITLAANVGLFNRHQVKRYPAAGYSCRASLHRLVKRDYQVRHAVQSDLDRLCHLEQLCWQHTRTDRQRLLARLREYPQGQFVLEKAGRVLGAIYSQRIRDAAELSTCDAHNVHRLHDEAGSTIQLLAVNIDPEVQNMGYGDQLLEFMLQRCGLVDGVDRVVGITLCKNYPADGPAYEEYIQQRGVDEDPVLVFHRSHGASVVRALPDYRPEDIANRGYGVLVEYDILNRHKHVKDKESAERAGHASALSEPVAPEQISRFVKGRTAQLLRIDEAAIDTARPLMELGLDSADLLKLQEQIEDQYGRNFQSGFFFEHNSIDKVINHLLSVLPTPPGNGAVQQIGPERQRRMPPVTGARQQSRSPELPATPENTDIAVVGMSCKLPGGIETPEQLWERLASGDCMIGAYPENRGGWPDDTDQPAIGRGGFVEHVDAFDADFFRISPVEARATDPQQRILLELSWACLEDAGVIPDSIKNTDTGVFIGASNCDYSRLIQQAVQETQPHHATGGSLAILANRLSYFLDLSGPSLVIDTACSASLVALHTAVRSLRSGESSAVLVGGVNVICHPDLSVAYNKAGMLATDGRCKVFDSDADGYVRSEGAVMMMLKRLDQAIDDKHRIHAVIKGSAVNHGGLSGGLTVPNPRKQSELLVAAWRDAGIPPEQISYLEAHGTGTSLGDPIEIQGMQQAYETLSTGRLTDECAVGSVKSNLGHLEPAAGITGLLKVVLAMRHGEIPASINFKKLNPKIRLEGSPFRICSSLTQWDTSGLRTAGVSSFGSGGANAHAVVQEWREPPVESALESNYLFVLSARDEERLTEYAESICSWIASHSGGVSFKDFVYTFQTGRTPMRERLAVATTGFENLKHQLEQWIRNGETGKSLRRDNTAHPDERLHALLQGDLGRRIVDTAVADRSMEQLALLWTSGFHIHFPSLYTDTPRFISAPTYPFSKKAYWVGAHSGTGPVDPLLGQRTASNSGVAFSKTWNRLPEQAFFGQDDFSCLSLGFILELIVSAGSSVLSRLDLIRVDDFNFYPFHMDKGESLACEVHCQPVGEAGLNVEFVQVVGDDRFLIADAGLVYSRHNESKPVVESSGPGVDWIVSSERTDCGRDKLPRDTLTSIFPALVDDSFPSGLSIATIQFHRPPVSESSMLVALSRSGISLFTSEKQPVLSISQ